MKRLLVRSTGGFFTLLALLSLPVLHAQAPAALVRHAPVINGTIEGSVQQMQPESVTLSGGAIITGELFVPGTPTLRLNGNPTFGGTVMGTGAASPTTHIITLNGGARLGRLRTHVDAVALPSITAPPTPAGTRSVALNHAGQSPGDFATLRSLTLSGNIGSVAIPPGVYGDFTANGGSGFTLGVAGATTAAVYAFQHLTLNGNSSFTVVGPVIVTMANALTANSSLGSSSHPDWLTLQFSNGGLTLNGQTMAYGYVLAPNGTITVNGPCLLAGGLVSDRLTVNGGGTLRLIAPAVTNQPPSVSLIAPSSGTSFVAPAAFPLVATASDADGTVAKVEFYAGTTKLGEATAPPYQFAITALAAGSYVFKARAIDNGNAASDSAPISVRVGVNQPPGVALTSPLASTTLTAPATITLAATATDTDGTVSRVAFYRGAIKLGEVAVAPFQLTISGLVAGHYSFTARATDNGNATTDSSPVAVTVVSPPNQSPTVVLTAPVTGASFIAPATVVLAATASDPDGTVTQVEFFQGAINLGASVVMPYQYSVSNLVAGNYTFTARATDNLGTTADSAPITVSVVGANQPPTIVLDAPLSGTLFNAPATIRLGATASDPDGSIAKVEFYQGTTKLGESAAAPFAYVWTGMLPGSYALSAKAYDNQGASTSTPANLVIVQAVLPYLTDFEAAEGYTLGALHGQGGWTATGGAAVTDADHSGGSRSATLPAGAPAAQVSRTVPTYVGQNIVFIDLFAKLVASPEAASAGYWLAEGAKVALVKNGALGELHTFDGDGAGSGQWRATGYTVGLVANGQTSTWLRLTVREDFTAKKWDLYAGGKVIATDLGFIANAAALFSQFSVTGSSVTLGTPTLFDTLFIGFDNPLFTDADKDGMDDAWETLNGLNPALNDRNADKDGDGLTNLREYRLGLRADQGSTFADGIPDSLRVSLGLSLTGPTVDTTAPTAPTSVAATASGLNIALTWTASTDNIGIAGYRVYRNGLLVNATTIQSTSFAETVPSDGASYAYEVRAVDFAGNRSAPGSTQITIPAIDADGNGLPDSWELRHFGHTGVSASTDDDGDGSSNLQEFQNGTDPTDYFNGIAPVVTPLVGATGELDPDGALSVRITAPNGNPLANAPVTLTAAEGGPLVGRDSRRPRQRRVANPLQRLRHGHGLRRERGELICSLSAPLLCGPAWSPSSFSSG